MFGLFRDTDTIQKKKEPLIPATLMPLKKSNKTIDHWVYLSQDSQLPNEFIDVLPDFLHAIAEDDVSSARTSKEESSILWCHIIQK